MSQAPSTQHPRPWILVAAYLVIVVGLSALETIGVRTRYYGFFTIVLQAITQIGPSVLYLLKMLGLTAISLWLSFRVGGVTRATIYVPIALIVVSLSVPVLIPTIMRGYFSGRSLVGPYFIWSMYVGPVLQQWIVFVIICCGTGLHLRPVDKQALPKSLSVSLLMALTAALAFTFAVEVFLQRSGAIPQIPNTILSGLTGMLWGLSSNGLSLTLLFGIVLLFVQDKSAKSFGKMLLALWVIGSWIYMMLYYQVIWPVLTQEIDGINQGNGVTSTTVTPSSVSIFGQYAILAVLTLFTVSLFHLAGYRWDRNVQRGNSEAINHAAVTFADIE